MAAPEKSARKIEFWPLERLQPYARNARTHSQEQIDQIAASIERFGFTNPILVDGQSGIVAGHGRLQAARQVGLEKVPVIRLDHLSDEEKRAYVIADNKLALNAGWDAAMLASEIEALMSDGFDIGLLGFGQDELGDLFGDVEADDAAEDAPPLPETPISRLGDVWVLGDHRLVCGDSSDEATVRVCLAGTRPHLMVTDPPYGVEYDPAWRQRAGVGGKGTATGKVENDENADWRSARAHFPGDVAYVWHGGLHAGVVGQSLEAHRFQVRAQIVWVKTRPVLSRGHYHWQHEPALYAVREGVADDHWQGVPEPEDPLRFEPEHEAATYAVREGANGHWNGSRRQSTVWFIEHVKSETGHGTQKPVDCMRRPIENNSRRGDTIYEPFSGSGTTLIACEITGRACRAIELSPGYVDVAVRRWQQFTGRKARLEGTRKTFDRIAVERASS